MSGLGRIVACVVVIVAMAAGFARAQETVSGEVWLGSQLFTVEDLDNLTTACKLSDDERAGAQEVMRGAQEQRGSERRFACRAADRI